MTFGIWLLILSYSEALSSSVFCKTLMYDGHNDTQVSECDVLTRHINYLLMCSLLSRNLTLTLYKRHIITSGKIY